MSAPEALLTEIQSDFVRDLSDASADYLRLGLELFHKRRQYDSAGFQAALGNLSIGVELMTKAFLASKNILLVFRGLTLDLRLLVTCPADVDRVALWRRLRIEIRSDTAKTLGFDETMEALYLVIPQVKEAHHSQLRTLAKYRNLSVHTAVASYHQYEMERAAYAALQILEMLRERKKFNEVRYWPTAEDKEFLRTFVEERLERVKRITEEAIRKSRTLSDRGPSLEAEDWESFVINCPICGSDAALGGYTDDGGELDEDGLFQPGLDFYAETLKCEECGFNLDDPEELRLAGLQVVYDRSNEIDQWVPYSVEEL